MRMFCPISGNKSFDNFARQHHERLGHIIGPSYFLRPKEGITFCLDNDAYKCFKENREFDLEAWITMLNKVEKLGSIPEWCAVPDVVCNRDKTLKQWEMYSHEVELRGWRTAFVIQDGMSLEDLPRADVYFVGGSTEWKWGTLSMWCHNLDAVHVGRVNWLSQLWNAQEHGADSCDGSGFMREGFHGRRMNGLKAWIHLKTNPQKGLFKC